MKRGEEENGQNISKKLKILSFFWEIQLEKCSDGHKYICKRVKIKNRFALQIASLSLLVIRCLIDDLKKETVQKEKGEEN